MSGTVGVEELEALAGALEAAPDLVVAVDAGGRVVFANAAARERWREPREAATLIPEPFREVLVDAVAAVLAGEPARKIEWGDLQHGVVRAWFSTAISPLAGGYLAISRDVSALKESEARLRRSEQMMVDTQGAAHLGTWEWDITQPTATWSDELYRIYGLTPETYEPSYEKYLTMVHPDDRQRVIDATNQVFHHHVPYSHDERIFRPDGSMRYLHTWAHPVLDDSGKLVRLVGVCQDITDRQLAEDEVRRMNVDLEQRVLDRTRTIEASMRDLEAFNSMVSHDLRAPLSVISLCASVLQRDLPQPLPQRAGDNLERIQRAVTHMTRLVDELLKLARVGHTPLSFASVDLSALCDEVITEHRRAQPDRTVDVVIEQGLQCHGDPNLVRVAFSNLFDNAWKYSSRVSHARIEVGRVGNAFFVRDNGAGFDMSEAHRLFAPFERLHSPSEFAGTGVGLATVHRIVERHGGRIWAESAPGKGATFFVELP